MIGAPTGPLEPWAPGTVALGEFEAERPLGAGGFGRVELVRSLTTGHRYAVKRLIRAADDQGDLLSEAQRWIGLPDHPHVVTCHFVRTIGSEVCIFTEFAPDGSLAHLIGSGELYYGPPEAVLDRILNIAVQVADGLALAHGLGLLHLDVKPSNIVFSGPHAKITDFGLATTSHQTNESQLTMHMVLDLVIPEEIKDSDMRDRIRLRLQRAINDNEVGETIEAHAAGRTGAYSSPEQAAEGGSVGRGADLWSWALTVLEMFAGSRSWPSGTLASPVLSRLTGSPGLLRANMPVFVQELLRQCFIDDPGQRPRDLSLAARALVDGAEQLGRPLRTELHTLRPPVVEGGYAGRTLLSGLAWNDPRGLLSYAYEAADRAAIDAVAFWPQGTGSSRSLVLQDLRALIEARRVLEPIASTPDHQEALASILEASGTVRVRLGDVGAAIDDYRAALAIARSTTSSRAPEMAFHLLNHIAIQERERGNRDMAVRVATEALLLAQEHVKDDPRWREAVGTARLTLANTEGEVEKRLELFNSAAEEFIAASDEDSAARALAGKATLLTSLRHDDEAADAWQQVDRHLNSLSLVGRPDRQATKARILLNRSTSSGWSDEAMGWAAEAVDLLHELVEVEGVAEAAPDLGAARMRLGLNLEMRHQTTQARAVYAAAGSALRDSVIRDGRMQFAPNLARAYDHESSLADDLGEVGEAVRLAENSVEIWRRVVAHDHSGQWLVEMSEGIRKLTLARLNSHELEAAREVVDEGLSLFSDDPNPADAMGRGALIGLLAASASVSRAAGQADAAVQSLERAIDLIGKPTSGDRQTAELRSKLQTNLAHAWQDLRAFGRALELLEVVTTENAETVAPGGRRVSTSWLDARNSKFRLLLQFGDYDAALELCPELLAELDRWIEAGRVDLANERGRVQMSMAVAEFRRGNLREAVELAEGSVGTLHPERMSAAGLPPEAAESIVAGWRRLLELSPEKVPAEYERVRASHEAHVELMQGGWVEQVSTLMEMNYSTGRCLLDIAPTVDLAMLCGEIGLATGAACLYVERHAAALAAMASAEEVYLAVYDQTASSASLTGLANVELAIVGTFLSSDDHEQAEQALARAKQLLTRRKSREERAQWKRVKRAADEIKRATR